MNKLQQRIAELSPDKRALLQKWILENRTAVADAQNIPPRTSCGPCALSFAQQRLWFLAQLEPESPLYNIPKAIRILGPLNRAALQQALNAVVARHQTLRSTFDFGAGSPVQVIGEAPLLELPVLEVRAMAAAEREAEIQRLSEEEARRPFNLSKDLMIRTLLLQVSDQEHVLLLTMHHIASDGWSMEILFREIASFYEDFSGGRRSRLPDLPIQYADYAVWQRKRLEGEALASQLTYWKKQLGHLAPVLELPADHPRPAIQSHRGASQAFRLPRELSEELRGLSRREGVTLFMTLLAAFQTLLHRYTGKDDIVIGSPIAGRDRMETEGLIGFFVNTLVLRGDLSGDPSFRDLLGRVREVALEAFAHQELPFEKLVEELQPDRNLSHNPLFQVVFVMQNTPRQKLELAGLSLIPREVDCKTAKFDLTLSIRDTTIKEQELVGSLEYNTDLFDGATVRRMCGHFQTLLEGILADPEQPLSTLPLMTKAERLQVVEEWNATRADYPPNQCIHRLFESQAQRTPDAVAVVGGDQQLAYGELNRRANQLAHYLRNRGVGRHVLVGICLERSPEMLIALLAVLKAGGAYLPLDSSYPKDRLKVMLEDAQVSMLLTAQRAQTNLPNHEACAVCLDTDWPAISRESDKNLAVHVDGEELAYVLYTSGSTGKPKGVQVPHRALSNHMQWMQAEFPLTADDSVVQRTRCGFDASVWEFYAPLLAGARLVVPRPAEQSDAAGLIRVIQTQQVTILQLVPSLLRILLDETGFENCRSLRRVFCGGEPLTVELRDRFLAALSTELCNLYGPTEACIDATFYRCTASLEQGPIWSPGNRVDAVKNGIVPIGRPLANTQVYVLDPYQQPVPIGVAGELYIGGTGLARGYVNQPELTAEKFLANPFSQEPGSRLYRSGDLVRYGVDGAIEFLGRIDHQVKLRGFRIELGEIESVLGRHPAVRQAIVTLREDSPGDQRLVAYIVCREGHSGQMGELKRFLRQKLPDYMIPSAFLFLEALPLTPTGKVDRKSLPSALLGSPESETVYVAPRVPVEQVLARIWGEVLKLERVSIVDNFFELGGHSLLATQVTSRIRSTLRVDLPVRRLFEAPTVERLSQAIIAAEQAPGQAERIARIVMDVAAMSGEDLKHLLAKEGINHSEIKRIQPRGEVREIPLSFAQQRLWFLHQLHPDRAAYNISDAYHLSGHLHIGALQRAINEIIRRHEVFRTTFQSQDGQPFQEVVSQQFVELRITDLSKMPDQEKEAEVRRLAVEDAEYPFALAQGPLLRASLLRLDAEEHALLLCMHHIVSDGWSMNLFFQEVAVLYEAFSTGKPTPLADLAIQYADFAIWQRDWLQGEMLQKQLDYWKQQLGNFTNELTLPTDRPRPVRQTHRGAKHSIVIAKCLTGKLKALSRDENVTLFMLLLAAFKVLLHRHSGQEDIIVGSPIANRNQTETEGLIGFFVNTLVLRTKLSGNPCFRELLARVRETAVGAYAHQDLPFEKLVEELQPARSLSHSPLFQIMFTLQNVPATSFTLADLDVAPLPIVSHVAKFDLMLAVVEGEEQLQVSINYNSDLFEAATVIRLGDHYGTLLKSIVDHPGQPIASLGLMTEAERVQVVEEWNATETEYPRGAGLHQLFELRAERTPESVAVVFGKTRWSYCELNVRANQLAHYLRQLGTKPEELVGVCLDRSAEMIVALLGILKAGGAYVPLDSNYPQERLSFLLKDSHTRLFITHRRELNTFPQKECRTVCLDSDWKAISRESNENPISVTGGANAAYVIYTSGSTGMPKGVIATHRAVTRLAIHTDYVKLTPADVVAQVSNASFDAATWEIWGALLNGARLVGISTAVLLSPTTFAARIREDKISAMFLTTALFNQMAREFPSAFQTVQHLLFGGEAADAGCVRAVLRHGPPRRFLNVYGPTETTTFASSHSVDQVASDATTIPIGRPIKNCQMYVLDAHLQPAPVGVQGELYVAGDGLARGYLNHSELTAERFIPNPLSFQPGSRLYRTGDLACYRSEGHIEFLGRVDRQVKLRGFRVELGEIEEALSQHSAVQEAIVLAREGAAGEKCLVAYAIPLPEACPTAQELRKFLQAKLPDYMVPSDFVFLDRFPITPNGKVNREALPVPDPALSRLQTEKSFAQPKDELELQLLNIWKGVLRIPGLGVTDNFFQVGGHSLLAARLVAAIEKVIGRVIPLGALFQASTIEQMARFLRDQESSMPWSLLVPIQVSGSRPPFFFLHGTRELGKYMNPDQPFYILQAHGNDEKAIPSTVEVMAAQYIREILRVQPFGPYFLGGYSLGGMVAFEIVQQLRQSGEKVAFLVLLDPTDPSCGKETPHSIKVSERSTPTFARIQACLARQLRKLARVEFRQWPTYLTGAIKWRVERSAVRMTTPIKRIICRYYLSRKGRVPCALRDFYWRVYWLEVNRQVARGYKPSVYPGGAVLFSRKDRSADALSTWNTLVAGGLQIEWVPGDHVQIIKEPQVQAVAAQLNRYLCQAQGTMAEKTS